jgi:hypothetical protein
MKHFWNRSCVKVFSLLILIFSFRDLQAAVQPISPKDGIWNVLTRIGIAIDSLALSSACTTTFGQAEVNTGYFILSPGTYCLGQNVSGSAAASAIIVASNDVTIDLQGHTIANVINAISLEATSVSNVIIKNGTIENCTNGIINSTLAVFLTNIAIRDMNFNNNGVAVSLSGGVRTSGLLIENCNAYNSSNIFASNLADTAIVRGCVFEEVRGGFIPVGVQLVGNGVANILIEDCVSTGSLPANPNLISIFNAQNGMIRNCVAQDGSSQMIQVGATQNVVISDCIAERATGFGITIAGNQANANVLIERCVTSQTAGFEIKNNAIPALALAGVKVIDCVAENNSGPAGFLLQPTTTTISDVVFKRCCAIGNNGSGFLVYLVSVHPATSIFQLVFEDCIAQGNAGDGFTIVNAKAGGSIQGVLFSNCIAQGNRGGANPIGTVLPGDGFGIGSTAFTTDSINDVMIKNCIAQGNTRDGVNLGLTVIQSQVAGCQANANNNVGFVNQNATPTFNNFLNNQSLFNNSFVDYSGVAQVTAARNELGLLTVNNFYYNISS